jgi:Antibiotic biosynthesis monooxygenase
LKSDHPNLAWSNPSKSNQYLNLRRTVAIPDYCSTPGNKGAHALRRMERDTAHFLMVTFWESEEAIRAFAGDDISVAKYYDFDKDFLLELEPCFAHYEMHDK